MTIKKNKLLDHSCTNNIGSWLRSAIALTEPASDEITASLKLVEKNLSSPTFSICFVGEFSRGKSTLINNLLEQAILPVGSLPTSAVLTSIEVGRKNSLEVLFDNGNKEVRELSNGSWQDLIATDPSGKDQEPSARVKITLKSDWLKRIDAEILDTPGAGDLSSKRADLVSQVLDQSDAAVLVVSATMPLSQTEIAFLEKEVIGRHIPNILVVVSKLDLLTEDERIKNFSQIKEKISLISKDVMVLPLHTNPENTSVEFSLELVRKNIEVLINKEERVLWRSQRIALQIVENLEHLIEVAFTAKKVLNMNAEEKAKKLIELQQIHKKLGLDWEGIRLDLDKRRLEHERKLRDDVNSSKKVLLETFLREIKRIQDPKAWWENLPYRLNKELLVISRKHENQIKAYIEKDFIWYNQKVKLSFSTNTNYKAESSESQNLDAELEHHKLTDIKKQRLMSRIGSGASMGSVQVVTGLAALGGLGSVLGGVLLLPISLTGIAVGVGVGIALDHRVQIKLDQEKELLSAELRTVLEKSFSEFLNSLSDQIKDYYSQLVDHSKKQQKTWQAAREAPLKPDNKSVDIESCQKIIDKSRILIEEIINSIN